MKSSDLATSSDLVPTSSRTKSLHLVHLVPTPKGDEVTDEVEARGRLAHRDGTKS